MNTPEEDEEPAFDFWIEGEEEEEKEPPEAPPEALQIREQLTKSFPFEKARREQLLAFDALTPWLERLFKEKFKPSFFGIDSPTGCHARKTPILMFDGTIKYVQDVKTGDIFNRR